MVSRILRAKSILSLSTLALICAVGLSAQAQTPKAKAKKPSKAAAKPAETPAAAPVKATVPAKTAASPAKPDADEEVSTRGETLKFNTDAAPASTDRHEPMIFKDPGAAPLGTPRKEFADATPEDAGFKTYIGYPKYIVGLYAAPMNIASAWTAGGSSAGEYNFTAGATGLGANVRIIASPLWNVELDYQQYSMTMSRATIGTAFTFNESKANFNNYFMRNKFCLIDKATFYQQLCPGLDIGNDGYPIVNYTSGSTLELTRVQDIMVGVNLTYMFPVGRSVMLDLMAGYNYGTGIGNSGYLTSKNNSSYFGEIGLDWNVTEHVVVTAGVAYKARKAKVSGVIGSAQDTWTTNSSTLGGKLGAGWQF